MHRRCYYFCSAIILIFVITIYLAFGFINYQTPTLDGNMGSLNLSSANEPMMLLAGEWLCYPGTPAIEDLDMLDAELIDIRFIGSMSGNTFRITLSGKIADDLYFMLPRPRGSQLFIDGQEVLSSLDGAVSSQDIFLFSDYLAPAQQHDLVLRVPGNSYFYSGYQGIIIGDLDHLSEINAFYYNVDIFCLGLYFTLVIVLVFLFFQKRSESYILYLIFYTIITAYRFMSFSAHFAQYPFFQPNSQFYRIFFFPRYMMCRALLIPGQKKKLCTLDYIIIAMMAAELITFLLIPSYFSIVSLYITYISLIIEGILIAKGIYRCKLGARILLFGWATYIGREIFFTLMYIGLIPQGIIDAIIRPAQFAYLIYLLAFTAAILGRFAEKFSEAEEMSVSLEQKVFEQTQQLREKNQRIIQEQNQRQQFMTDVVHNLRNPLFALGGYMELLETQIDQPTAEQKKYVSLIEDKLAYVNRMVDDMLLANRLEHGKIRFHFIRLELSAFLRNVVMGNKYLEQCGQVHITCPEICLDADSFRLHQALDNLFDNAVIHGNSTCIDIIAKQNENDIHLTIRDDGKGMTQEQVSRAFDRYYTSEQKNSTGLGLSIAAAIIREHQGQIAIESNLGQGVCIHIILPSENDEAKD